MKKSIIGCIALMLVLVGCKDSSTKVTKTCSFSSNGIETKITFEAPAKDKAISKVTLNANYAFDSLGTDGLKDFTKAKKEEFAKNFISKLGMDEKATTFDFTNEGLNIKTTLEGKALTEIIKSSSQFSSFEATIKQYEDNGSICK